MEGTTFLGNAGKCRIGGTCGIVDEVSIISFFTVVGVQNDLSYSPGYTLSQCDVACCSGENCICSNRILGINRCRHTGTGNILQFVSCIRSLRFDGYCCAYYFGVNLTTKLFNYQRTVDNEYCRILFGILHGMVNLLGGTVSIFNFNKACACIRTDIMEFFVNNDIGCVQNNTFAYFELRTGHDLEALTHCKGCACLTFCLEKLYIIVIRNCKQSVGSVYIYFRKTT